MRSRFGRHLVAGLVVTLATTVVVRTQLIGALSEAEEIELGRLAALEMEKDLTLLADETVTSYVAALGETLAARSDRSALTYQFTVVDTEEINAFALPGGYIYVHRGLIEAADNEAELAGVLGHEIAHVVARHGAEQAQRSAIAGLGLRVLGSLLGQGTGGQIGTIAAEMVTAGTFMRFSRDAEREADRLGAENVAAAGLDPNGMVTFFEKLDALREGQANAVERFFASHPSPAERVSNVQDLLRSLASDGRLVADSERFREVARRLEELPRPPPPVASNTEDAAGARPTPDADPIPEELVDVTYPGVERDRAIAARFAPVFRQALGDSPRFDYITSFDFDGDWRGDNNWDNAADEDLRLPAVVYFNVAETTTHYFVHYAAFHPRDYKGGNIRGVVLSEIMREGVARHGDYDPTGLAESAVLAHENDMEGALVVATKGHGDLDRARVEYVETLAHNKFLRYEPSRSLFGLFRLGSDDGVRLENGHPVLYIEPKGHGIEAYHGADQLENAEGVIDYRYTARAETTSATRGESSVGYDLISLAETLWPRARAGENPTYGGVFDYRSWTVRVSDGEAEPEDREIAVGPIGALLRGEVGGRNMARPPWGWFDRDEEGRRQGEWFLTPAETIARHFDVEGTVSAVYVHHPAFGIYRD